MGVGVWLVPVVLVAMAAFLWASAWLESVTIPGGQDPELQTWDPIDPGLFNAESPTVQVDDGAALVRKTAPAPLRDETGFAA